MPFRRLDDLRQSIVDGRYKEQKQRLAECGLANKWYLVEDFKKHKRYWVDDPNARVAPRGRGRGNKPCRDGGEEGPSNRKGFSKQALEQAIASTSANG